ncbi:hypothetical protein J6590_030037 [Homalodisca vitripennis]|nr:hypothetical protein J6590_030037 [Homalodisca vitripennis]
MSNKERDEHAPLSADRRWTRHLPQLGDQTRLNKRHRFIFLPHRFNEPQRRPGLGLFQPCMGFEYSRNLVGANLDMDNSTDSLRRR